MGHECVELMPELVSTSDSTSIACEHIRNDGFIMQVNPSGDMSFMYTKSKDSYQEEQ